MAREGDPGPGVKWRMKLPKGLGKVNDVVYRFFSSHYQLVDQNDGWSVKNQLVEDT